VPFSTEETIEPLCSELKALCNKPFSAETKADLRELARELRLAIKDHVEFAKSSLHVKQAAIVERDASD